MDNVVPFDRAAELNRLGKKLLVNRKEAAAIIGVSVDIADRDFLYEPDFPAIQRGKRRYYIKNEIEPWLVEHQQ